MTAVNGTAAIMAVSATVLAVGVAACDKDSSPVTSPFPVSATSSSAGSSAGGSGSTAPTSGSGQPVDYTRLLITARDVLAPDDVYTAQPPVLNPNGTQGAEVLFTNHDQTRAIGDSIVNLPDSAAAASALRLAGASLGTSVTGGDPQPSPVGTGGAVVSGMSPDATKTVTILMFTEGRGFARLEFDSAPGNPTPADFVTDIGQKQDIALRTGLSR